MEKQAPNPDWQKIAEARQEKITIMGEFLDNLARIIGVPVPKTPQEGIGAVQDMITAIQVLQWKETRDQEAIETLRTVVGAADKYLEFNNTVTNISSGSSLHRAFKEAIEATTPIKRSFMAMLSEPAPRGTCTWTQPKDSDLEDSDSYVAGCDASIVTYLDDDMTRCYRCGLKIVIVEA
jgi:hypothetical protein